MRIKNLSDEDFVNYCKPSMFIGTISCSGKCCSEAGIPLSVCQNDDWRSAPVISIDDHDLCRRYLKNPITRSIVFGGLEPFEQFDELYDFIFILRTHYHCLDDVVIYSGYDKKEIIAQLVKLSYLPNIVVKFGRFRPDSQPRYDEVLGVTLASDNQYAERIS